MKCRVCGHETDGSRTNCPVCGARFLADEPDRKLSRKTVEMSWNTMDFPKPKGLEEIEIQWPEFNTTTKHEDYSVDNTEELMQWAGTPQTETAEVSGFSAEGSGADGKGLPLGYTQTFVPVGFYNSVPKTEKTVQEPAAPVYQEPVTPVYQQPAAPVYQQPVTPVYQQPAAPVYQQPVAPAYQQPEVPVYQEPVTPVYQQPAAPVQNEPAAICWEPDAPAEPLFREPEVPMTWVTFENQSSSPIDAAPAAPMAGEKGLPLGYTQTIAPAGIITSEPIIPEGFIQITKENRDEAPMPPKTETAAEVPELSVSPEPLQPAGPSSEISAEAPAEQAAAPDSFEYSRKTPTIEELFAEYKAKEITPLAESVSAEPAEEPSLQPAAMPEAPFTGEPAEVLAGGYAQAPADSLAGGYAQAPADTLAGGYAQTPADGLADDAAQDDIFAPSIEEELGAMFKSPASDIEEYVRKAAGEPEPIPGETVHFYRPQTSDREPQKFYTFQRKNEEFQRLLDEQYERIRSINESTRPEPAAAGFGGLASAIEIEDMAGLEELLQNAAPKAEPIETQAPAYEAPAVPQEAEAPLTAEELAAEPAEYTIEEIDKTIRELEAQVVYDEASKTEKERRLAAMAAARAAYFRILDEDNALEAAEAGDAVSIVYDDAAEEKTSRAEEICVEGLTIEEIGQPVPAETIAEAPVTEILTEVPAETPVAEILTEVPAEVTVTEILTEVPAEVLAEEILPNDAVPAEAISAEIPAAEIPAEAADEIPAEKIIPGSAAPAEEALPAAEAPKAEAKPEAPVVSKNFDQSIDSWKASMEAAILALEAEASKVMVGSANSGIPASKDAPAEKAVPAAEISKTQAPAAVQETVIPEALAAETQTPAITEAPVIIETPVAEKTAAPAEIPAAVTEETEPAAAPAAEETTVDSLDNLLAQLIRQSEELQARNKALWSELPAAAAVTAELGRESVRAEKAPEKVSEIKTGNAPAEELPQNAAPKEEPIEKQASAETADGAEKAGVPMPEIRVQDGNPVQPAAESIMEESSFEAALARLQSAQTAVYAAPKNGPALEIEIKPEQSGAIGDITGKSLQDAEIRIIEPVAAEPIQIAGLPEDKEPTAKYEPVKLAAEEADVQPDQLAAEGPEEDEEEESGGRFILLKIVGIIILIVALLEGCIIGLKHFSPDAEITKTATQIESAVIDAATSFGQKIKDGVDIVIEKIGGGHSE